MTRRGLLHGTTTLTRKGQLTIPVVIRHRLGLTPGTVIDLRIVGDELHGTPCPTGGRGAAEEVSAR